MLKVSFEFDEESKAVTNVKVVKVPSKYDNIDLPIVEIGDSKLIMSPKAVSLLSAQCGDRIAVNYIQKVTSLQSQLSVKLKYFQILKMGTN